MGRRFGIDVHERLLQAEWMDAPGLDVHLHHAALWGLGRVNAWSLIHRSFWPAIQQLAQRQPTRELRILDVACGGGDVAVRLYQMARKAKVRLTVEGCDLSQTAVDFARERAEKSGVPCRFFQFDALQDEWPTDFDVIVNSLFLHHLTRDAAIGLLGHMAASTRSLLLLNDLVRSRKGYLLARVGTHLLSRSPVVHSDAPISVEGAFTAVELQEMACRAGLDGATVSRSWPARMLLKWNKP